MDFNTLLLRLGLDPDDFINKESVPVKTEEGFLYEAEQRTDIRKCPYCLSDDCRIQDRRYSEINCSENDHIRDVLRVKRTRFLCRKCGRTFTPPLNGIRRGAAISEQTRNMIVKDFAKQMTFSEIAGRYGISSARVIQIFDEVIGFMPRKKMPFALCIDEIRFREKEGQNYCCVLYDFNGRNIVDIIRNRQMAYLDEYFPAIPEVERRNVKYFISDMYDGYRTVRKRYFPSALHIVDLFHVISQMTRAVSRIRTSAMKKTEENSLEYRFMKRYWRFFLCRKEDIPERTYESKKTGLSYSFEDLVFRCVLKDQDLLLAYNALQDLYHYNQQFFTFREAHIFINKFADRLTVSGNALLEEVGSTYRKWAVEIANGLARSQSGKHYTNGIAESINNHLKTIIKAAYGYHNFERFRKRAMMIITYKKELR